jgi:hypothetical protein
MEDFDFEISSWLRAIFGTIFGTLLTATIVSQGELMGLAFAPMAIFSAAWLCALVSKEIRKKQNEERSTENAE